ncbi:MAG TPA: MaoC family dehydratase [Pseudomonas sp.]|uniref:MaoC family dehydratase n=1 Tax=Pseudomonas sp. TaxID=306 RepID=UPI002B4779E1|nr:MaoC family dehydratase [Pseudomonas sp.]HKS15274.1 MaoC family dehydratase [Pseudomonas sp.]
MQAKPSPEAPLYMEDLSPGDTFTSGTYLMDAEKILAFGREFDPQPFHTDPELAKDTFFEGLAASGWHTAAVCMRLLVESLPVAGGLIGAGSEVRWPQPTRPGDVLRVITTVQEIIPSRSRPDRGIAHVESLVLNQRDEVCQRSMSRVVVLRRPA